MLSYRLGLLFLTFILSACSVPSSQQSAHKPHPSLSPSSPETTLDAAQPEDTEASTSPATQQSTTHLSPSPVTQVNQNLLAKMSEQQQNANELYQQLVNALGPDKAPAQPQELSLQTLSNKVIEQHIETLQAYNQQAEAQLAALNERAQQRKTSVIQGDHLQIFFSELTISHPNNNFQAQPLVGQWVRGEQRTIRLNNNFLIEPALSEALSVTFNEDYQLLLNGQLISTIKPSLNKNQASFEVATQDQQGQVSGKLDYRIVTPNTP